jgi:hypothetical protein
MPSVPQTWFQANFGQVPTSFSGLESGGPQLDPYGREIPQLQPSHEYDLSVADHPGAFTRYSDDVIQGWRNANAAAAEARRRADAAVVTKFTQDRLAQAAIRASIRTAMSKANVHTTTDWSALNVPADAGQGNAMITLPGQAKDLGRNITDKDPFFTGQFETKTNTVYGQPRNRYEAMLDTGPVQGTEVTKTPIVAHAMYRDSAGEAMRYSQQKRLDQAAIQQWQAFFVNAGTLKPGAFQFGAWDAATQDAMYNLMGQANAMGQSVDSMRSGYEQSWAAMGGGPGAGGGSGGSVAQPRDVTQKVYSVTSLAKGGELLRAYLQQELGRDPSSAEISAYVRLLNGKERKNPTITNTHYSANGASSTSVVQEANVDSQASAHDYMTSDMKQELAGRQAMEYMNALAGM